MAGSFNVTCSFVTGLVVKNITSIISQILGFVMELEGGHEASRFT